MTGSRRFNTVVSKQLGSVRLHGSLVEVLCQHIHAASVCKVMTAFCLLQVIISTVRSYYTRPRCYWWTQTGDLFKLVMRLVQLWLPYVMLFFFSLKISILYNEWLRGQWTIQNLLNFHIIKTVGKIPTVILKNDYQERGNHTFTMVKRWWEKKNTHG